MLTNEMLTWSVNLKKYKIVMTNLVLHLIFVQEIHQNIKYFSIL